MGNEGSSQQHKHVSFASHDHDPNYDPSNGRRGEGEGGGPGPLPEEDEEEGGDSYEDGNKMRSRENTFNSLGQRIQDQAQTTTVHESVTGEHHGGGVGGGGRTPVASPARFNVPAVAGNDYGTHEIHHHTEITEEHNNDTEVKSGRPGPIDDLQDSEEEWDEPVERPAPPPSPPTSTRRLRSRVVDRTPRLTEWTETRQTYNRPRVTEWTETKHTPRPRVTEWTETRQQNDNYSPRLPSRRTPRPRVTEWTESRQSYDHNNYNDPGDDYDDDYDYDYYERRPTRPTTRRKSSSFRVREPSTPHSRTTTTTSNNYDYDDDQHQLQQPKQKRIVKRTSLKKKTIRNSRNFDDDDDYYEDGYGVFQGDDGGWRAAARKSEFYRQDDEYVPRIDNRAPAQFKPATNHKADWALIGRHVVARPKTANKKVLLHHLDPLLKDNSSTQRDPISVRYPINIRYGRGVQKTDNSPALTSRPNHRPLNTNYWEENYVEERPAVAPGRATPRNSNRSKRF